MCLDNGIALDEQVVSMTSGEWPTMKPKCIFGQLPIVYDGDFEIAQSNAILRHIARAHGLYGKDDREKTQIDMINDSQEDLRLTYLKLIYQQYDTEKDNYVKSLPEKLAVFEKVLGKNHGGKGFYVGEKASFLDYNMFDLLDNLLLLAPHCLDTYPLLKAYYGRIAAHDKLTKYRASDAFKGLQVNGNGKQ